MFFFSTSHTGDNRITLETNYFKLAWRSATIQWKIYKYNITFDPECSIKRVQMFLIGQHRSEIGGYLFDGNQLFATRKLHKNSDTVEYSTQTRDERIYKIHFKFTKIVLMNEQESLQVLNLILRRNMNGLKLALIGRNFYEIKYKCPFFGVLKTKTCKL